MRWTSGGRHQTDIDVFIKRMIFRLNVFKKGEEDDPFSIWRDVWEPIVVFVLSYLFLLGTVRFHPPNLHQAAERSVKLIILSFRRLFGAIIKSWRVDERRLFGTNSGNSIDI